MNNSAPVTLEFNRVSKCFRTGSRGQVWAVRDFSLVCNPGEFTCLVGPSGCGKTTILRMAAGLDQPTSGKILINGRPAHQGEHRPGYVSQEGDLLPWRRVEDNIALGLEIQGVPRKQRTEIARCALAAVGLPPDVARSYPHELSGGMRQRVVLARMACLNPRLMLMDEPFANLDEATRHRLQQDLVQMWQRERPTVLFVTHSLDEAVYLADRIIVLRSEGIVLETKVDLPRPRDRLGRDSVEFASKLRVTLHGA